MGPRQSRASAFGWEWQKKGNKPRISIPTITRHAGQGTQLFPGHALNGRNSLILRPIYNDLEARMMIRRYKKGIKAETSSLL
jgi:hypothetical protein